MLHGIALDHDDAVLVDDVAVVAVADDPAGGEEGLHFGPSIALRSISMARRDAGPRPSLPPKGRILSVPRRNIGMGTITPRIARSRDAPTQGRTRPLPVSLGSLTAPPPRICHPAR
ncbi:hypothetical protein GCM10011534_34070 [Pseudooceanicola nanhaiensis]|uniref:Uncharacterized protein n=1 Tax=Pseudooceanicola nanhaiensis TaxID=375761 RepID=A0A917T4L6_9RHOB|nr:hypothetical protein GCM10011534_34070 [Pseudooceanicola nanhaiensis]